MALKTNVYVDAFNLYYGCLRKTPYRWLNLAELCAKILPRNEIHRIRYFTALVTPRPTDPQQRNRQEMYIRALRTLPNLTVHTGRYLASKVRMKRADGAGTVEVLKSEEKGSDVNLASYLLIDAYRSDCDVAVIVSNDSDLVFPIEHIKQQVGKIIGILNPRPRPSRELFPLAGFGVLVLSDIRMLRDFGAVTVIDLAVALIGVLIVLPAVLVLAERGALVPRWARLRRRRTAAQAPAT